ncbi:MAG: dienelactone hydrolase family protein [Candidatus Omnitrophica bacterium]|nr:dienelactone hydrolase family protein [Candidatus Omnitrophota bacterium]
MRIFLAIILMMAICSDSFAEIQKKQIEYKDGDTTLEGFLVYDDAKSGPQPGVIVVHDWMGFGAYANGRAEQLAQLGYTALAIDIYGKGVRPANTEEASKQAGYYKEHRDLLRRRAQAGLEALKKEASVDPKRMAAIGYCFGGTTVLEMARAGMPLAGVVSFHGGLSTSMPAHKGDIKSKVLVLHGADDPFVPPPEVVDFSKEVNEAGADWQMVSYSGAVHSFTRKDAGNDNSKGAAYNERADKRSWEAMKSFFNEIFQ